MSYANLFMKQLETVIDWLIGFKKMQFYIMPVVYIHNMNQRLLNEVSLHFQWPRVLGSS